ILDSKFSSLFVCRSSSTVDGLIEEDKGHLVIPDLTGSTTTSKSISLRLITGRSHGLNGRVDDVFDSLLVILDPTFIRRIQIVNTVVLKISRKHSDSRLDTPKVLISVLLVLIEVQKSGA